MKENRAIILLFLASFIWGLAFIFQSLATGIIGACYFTGIRMTLASVAMIPLFLKATSKHKGDNVYRKNLLIGGLVCGITTAIPCIIQQIGIEYTTAGKAGFITSLYILIVPVFSVILGKKVNKKVWLCVASGLVGAYLLCINHETGVNKGDLLILLCAFLFAIQIMCIAHYAEKLEGPDLASLQFFFGGVFSLIVAVISRESISFQAIKDTIIPILYTGLFSCGLAYTFQVIGQKYVAPAKASLPLSLENAWSAIFGAIVLGQMMSLRELLGCVILFVSVIISQIC